MDDTPTLAELGRFIRERRSSLKLTQAQLAERLRWSQERISVLENGKYGMPSVPALMRLTTALDVSFSDLLTAAGYPVVPSPLTSGTSDVALGYALQRLLEIDARSVEHALTEASDLLVQAMGADKIDAFVFDPGSDSLVAVGTSNTPMGHRQHELGLEREPLTNGGRTVEVYQTGVPYYTPQADQDPGMVPGVVRGLGVRSYFAVPLRPDGDVIGVLAAASAEADRFSDEERQFFEAVARWVAMIARRAQLIEELTRIATTEARRVAAEELVTILAHDLGNALSPISGRLDLFRRRLQREGWDRGLDDLDEASHSVQRVQRMVTELLDVARIDQSLFALSLQVVDLVALIEEVVEQYRPVRASISTRLPEELRVQADPARITQALQNLLGNAVRHTPEDVPIHVGAGSEEHEGRRWAVVSVEDEGPGIPNGVLDGLFTRFAAGSGSSGLGIGLYLARRIVEAHGGTVSVESAPGEGTSFRLSLPLDSATTPPAVGST